MHGGTLSANLLQAVGTDPTGHRLLQLQASRFQNSHGWVVEDPPSRTVQKYPYRCVTHQVTVRLNRHYRAEPACTGGDEELADTQDRHIAERNSEGPLWTATWRLLACDTNEGQVHR